MIILSGLYYNSSLWYSLEVEQQAVTLVVVYAGLELLYFQCSPVTQF